jgi:hypothetical protein
MPGKMARSDPRPSVRVTRGVGSGQHLASVLQEGRENANIDAGWDSSGDSRIKAFSSKNAEVLRHAAMFKNVRRTRPSATTSRMLFNFIPSG